MEREGCLFGELSRNGTVLKPISNESVLQDKATLQKSFDCEVALALRKEIASMENGVHFVNQEKNAVISSDQVDSVLRQKNKDINNVFGEDNPFQSLLDRQK